VEGGFGVGAVVEDDPGGTTLGTAVAEAGGVGSLGGAPYTATAGGVSAHAAATPTSATAALTMAARERPDGSTIVGSVTCGKAARQNGQLSPRA
jgi:hypothetical protein